MWGSYEISREEEARSGYRSLRSPAGAAGGVVPLLSFASSAFHFGLLKMRHPRCQFVPTPPPVQRQSPLLRGSVSTHESRRRDASLRTSSLPAADLFFDLPPPAQVFNFHVHILYRSLYRLDVDRETTSLRFPR